MIYDDEPLYSSHKDEQPEDEQPFVPEYLEHPEINIRSSLRKRAGAFDHLLPTDRSINLRQPTPLRTTVTPIPVRTVPSVPPPPVTEPTLIVDVRRLDLLLPPDVASTTITAIKNGVPIPDKIAEVIVKNDAVVLAEPVFSGINVNVPGLDAALANISGHEADIGRLVNKPLPPPPVIKPAVIPPVIKPVVNKIDTSGAIDQSEPEYQELRKKQQSTSGQGATVNKPVEPIIPTPQGVDSRDVVKPVFTMPDVGAELRKPDTVPAPPVQSETDKTIVVEPSEPIFTGTVFDPVTGKYYIPGSANDPNYKKPDEIIKNVTERGLLDSVVEYIYKLIYR